MSVTVTDAVRVLVPELILTRVRRVLVALVHGTGLDESVYELSCMLIKGTICFE